jgi:hypothetical protein
MIKVYKLKTIFIVLLVIALITGFILIIKKKTNYESIQTSNNKRSTYKILVDVEDSKLFLFENDKIIKVYKCSGGKISTPSPIGTWTIISKAKWGEGFGRKLDGTECSLGTVWNTRNTKYLFSRLAKLTWMYKNE